MFKKTLTTKIPKINIALAYQGFVDDPVPSVIFDAIETGAAKRAYIIGLLAVIFFAGISVPTIVQKFSNSPVDTYAISLSTNDIAFSSHLTFAGDLVHPVQVGAIDLEHLKDWLSYRVEHEVSVHTLDKNGFSLLGANLIPDGRSTSSMVIYENDKKERFSLFTRYSGGSVELSEPKRDVIFKHNLFSWQNRGNQYVMVSKINSADMRPIVERLAQ